MHFLRARHAKPHTRSNEDIQAARWARALLVVACTYLAMRVLPVLVPAIWRAL